MIEVSGTGSPYLIALRVDADLLRYAMVNNVVGEGSGNGRSRMANRLNTLLGMTACGLDEAVAGVQAEDAGFGA